MRHIRAGLWVMLHNTQIEREKSTCSLECAPRFLAPDRRNRMRFSSREEALCKNGVAVRLIMVKKCSPSEHPPKGAGMIEQGDSSAYQIRATAQILSNREDRLSMLRRPMSLGITRIEGESGLREFRTNLFANFFEHYREKIEELVTGRLAIREMASDYAQKNQPGSRTQELPNLLPGMADCRRALLGSPRREYPNVDGRIRAVQLILLFVTLQLILLSLLFLLQGDYVPREFGWAYRKTPYPQPEWLPSWRETNFYDLWGGIFALWALAAGVLVMAISWRRGRLATFGILLLWTAFCSVAAQEYESAKLLWWAWGLPTLYGLWVLTSLKTKAHFCPDFGPLCVPASRTGEIFSWMAALVLCAHFVYLARY
jgi:hypothetical protein